MAGEFTRLLSRGQIRASDEEREHTVAALRHHYSAGRLTADELEERIEGAYHATTRGDLDAVLYDLPSERGRRAAARVETANRAAWRAHATTFVAVNGGLTGLWAVTGGGEFWPGYPMAFWGMGLGWHFLTWRAIRARVSRSRRHRRVGGRTTRALPR